MNTTQAINRMREVIRRQHKALSTDETYVCWLRRYMAALRGMPQDLSSEPKLESFLTDLARRSDLFDPPSPVTPRALSSWLSAIGYRLFRPAAPSEGGACRAVGPCEGGPIPPILLILPIIPIHSVAPQPRAVAARPFEI